MPAKAVTKSAMSPPGPPTYAVSPGPSAWVAAVRIADAVSNSGVVPLTAWPAVALSTETTMSAASAVLARHGLRGGPPAR